MAEIADASDLGSFVARRGGSNPSIPTKFFDNFLKDNTMNFDSIDCRNVGFGEMERQGDFCFDCDCDCIYVWLPGLSGPDCIQVSRTPTEKSRVWYWDGNEEKPTLNPSINSVGEWHGYMKNGRLISC